MESPTPAAEALREAVAARSTGAPEGTEDRLQLLVRDPEWLFAHWDLGAASLVRLGRELGERVVAVAALTLRVGEPGSGSVQTLLVPRTQRSSYVRVQPGATGLQAELGLTLPSGEFRRLAASDKVSLPVPVPSPERARTVSYAAARGLAPGERFELSPRPLAEPSVNGRARGLGPSSRLGWSRRSE